MCVCLSASLVLAASVADAGLVHGASASTLALSTAGRLEAEVGDALVVGSAELTQLGKTLGRALVVLADTRSATLVLVAVSTDTLDGLALGVGAEGAANALGRLGASDTVGLRAVGDAALVDAVARSATRVLVASVTVLLDVLARATVAVRRRLALVVTGAERVVLASADLGDTLALVTRTRSAVGISMATRAGGSGGSGGSRRGRRDGGCSGVTTRVVVKGGGDVLEDLTVNKVTRDGLSHLESHKGGGGNEESGADGSTHYGGCCKIEVATLARLLEDPKGGRGRKKVGGKVWDRRGEGLLDERKEGKCVEQLMKI